MLIHAVQERGISTSVACLRLASAVGCFHLEKVAKLLISLAGVSLSSFKRLLKSLNNQAGLDSATLTLVQTKHCQ